jgi:acyl carrier protein
VIAFFAAEVEVGIKVAVAVIVLEKARTMSDAVAGKIIAMLAAIKHVPAEGITLDSSLQEMGIDSLDTFTLLFDLENEFHITIPDEEAKSIRTVNDVVEGVKKLIAAGNGSSVDSSMSAD